MARDADAATLRRRHTGLLIAQGVVVASLFLGYLLIPDETVKFWTLIGLAVAYVAVRLVGVRVRRALRAAEGP